MLDGDRAKKIVRTPQRAISAFKEPIGTISTKSLLQYETLNKDLNVFSTNFITDPTEKVQTEEKISSANFAVWDFRNEINTLTNSPKMLQPAYSQL